jgi:hypothetical protein
MKHTVEFDESTQTLRQMPENYLLAEKTESNGWICNPDMAADKELCNTIFNCVSFNYVIKWRWSGEQLAEGINFLNEWI